MKTVNIRFLLILVVSALLLAGAVHLVHGIQVSRQADLFLTRAESAEEDGKIVEAIRYYGDYLKLAPEDPRKTADATAKLGLLLAETTGSSQAYLTLSKALRQDPERNDVRRRLTEVGIRLGGFREAEDHLVNHLLENSPDDAELWDLLGQCQVGNGKYLLAAESFETAIEKNETRLDSYLRLIALLDARSGAFVGSDPGNEKDAAYWYDQMVEKNPNSPQAYLARAVYQLRQVYGKAPIESQPVPGPGAADEDQEETPQPAAESRVIDDCCKKAFQDAQKALDLEPNNVDALWLAAASALQLGRFEEARGYATSGQSLAEKDPRFYQTLWRIEKSDGRIDEAIQWLRSGLMKVSDATELPISLATLLIRKGRIDEAEQVIRTHLQNDPSPVVPYLRGLLEYRRQQWRTASRRFEEARGQASLEPGLAKQACCWLAKCHERLLDSEREIEAYRRSLAIDPLFPPARLGLIDALARAGRVDEAVQEVRGAERILRQFPEGLSLIARVIVQQNSGRPFQEQDWSGLTDLMSSNLEIAGTSIEPLLLQAEMLVAQKKVDQASDLLEKAHGETEKAIQSAENALAEVRAAQQPEDDAQKALEDAQARQASVLVALVLVAIEQNDRDTAKERLEMASEELGDTLAVRLARTSYLVSTRNRDGYPLSELAENTGEFSEAERSQLWRTLLAAAMRLGDLAEGERISQIIVDEVGNDLQIWQQIFEIANLADDRQLAQRSLDEIQNIEGEGFVWHYAQALQLMPRIREGDENAAREAQKHLTAASERRSRWSAVPLLEATIYDRIGKQDLALAKYLSAIELGAAGTDAIRRTVELLYQRQDFTKANELITQLAEEAVPLTVDLKRMQSKIWGRLDRLDEAIAVAREVVAGVGLRTISVLLVGKDGTRTVVGSKQVILRNERPAVALVGSERALKDEPYSLRLTLPEGGESHKFIALSIDWGDTSVEEFSVAKGATLDSEYTHLYGAPKTFTLSVSLAFENGAQPVVVTKDVTVGSNPPPLSLVGPDFLEKGASYPLTLTTPAAVPPASVSQCSIAWGDGTVDTFTVSDERPLLGEYSHAYVGNYLDHLWLGQLLAAAGLRAQASGDAGKGDPMLAEAEESLERARQLAPEQQGPYVALAQFYARSGKQGEIENVIADLERNVPERQIQRALASCHLAAGSLEEAADHFEKALAEMPDDPALVREVAEFCIRNGRPQMAKEGLKIVADSPQADEPQKAWCRRALALALRNEGGYQSLRQALVLIEQNLDLVEGDSSVLDRRTKAILLSSHPERARRQEAARILEELIESGSPGVQETRQILVRLYIAEGEWPKAIRHLRIMGDPDLLAVYVGYLLSQNQLGEARLRLGQLERSFESEAAKPLAAKLLDAELAFREKKYDKALNDLKSLLLAGEDGAQASGSVLRGAMLLERLAGLAAEWENKDPPEPAQAVQFAEAAEAAYRQAVQGRPDGELVLAMFLSRQGRLDESLETIRQSIATAPAPTLAEACVTLLDKIGDDPDHLKELEDVLEMSLAKSGRELNLLNAMSQLRTRQERFDDVESLYREMLQRSPGNPAVMNNLAVFLALRGRQLNEALELIQKAIEVAGPHAAMLDTRATVYLALGRTGDALADMQTVLAEEPTATRYFHLAWILQRSDRAKGASQALRQAETAGLTAEQLHPLERSAYRQMQARLQ